MDRPDAVLVEVDVAVVRPPRIDTRVWTWLAVDPSWKDIAVEAEQVAIHMIQGDRRVVMAVGARIIDWEPCHA